MGGTGPPAPPLCDTDAYQEAQEELETALNGIHDRQRAERAMLAARKLEDLHAQFFYRVSLQDGVRLTAADFPAQGIA